VVGIGKVWKVKVRMKITLWRSWGILERVGLFATDMVKRMRIVQERNSIKFFGVIKFVVFVILINSDDNLETTKKSI